MLIATAAAARHRSDRPVLESHISTNASEEGITPSFNAVCVTKSVRGGTLCNRQTTRSKLGLHIVNFASRRLPHAIESRCET
jgi:hypothetical protein